MQFKISELKLAAFLGGHDLFFKVIEQLSHLIKSVWVDSGVAVGIKASSAKTTKNYIINEKIGPYV